MVFRRSLGLCSVKTLTKMVAAKFLSLLLLVVSGSTSSSPVAECDFKLVAQEVSDAFSKVFGSQGHIPLNPDELSHDCSLAPSLVTNIENIVKPCVPESIQPLIPMALQGVNDFVTKICTTGGDFQNLYLKSAECFNQNMKDAAPCTEELEKNVLPLLHNIDLQKLCCSVSQFQFCTNEVVQKSCGNDASSFLKETFKLVEGELLQMVCGSADCTGWLTDAPPTA